MSKIKSIINKIIIQEMRKINESISFEDALDNSIKQYKTNELAAIANAMRGGQSELGQRMWSHLFNSLGAAYQISNEEIKQNRELILKTIDDKLYVMLKK